jgi:hypothetical protein
MLISSQLVDRFLLRISRPECKREFLSGLRDWMTMLTDDIAMTLRTFGNVLATFGVMRDIVAMSLASC